MTGAVRGSRSVRITAKCVAIPRTNQRKDRHMEDYFTFSKKDSQRRIVMKSLKKVTTHGMQLHHP